jgi:hypothetical protein
MPLYPVIRRVRRGRGPERLRSRRVVPLVTDVVQSAAEARQILGEASPGEIQAEVLAARVVGKPFQRKP